MNRIFKVVWSKSRQAYIVVSEYAKSRGGKTKIVAAVLAVIMGTAVQAPVWAANDRATLDPATQKIVDEVMKQVEANYVKKGTGNGTAVDNDMVKPGENPVKANAEQYGAVAIGRNAHAVQYRTVAIGAGAYANIDGGIAILGNTLQNDGISFGRDSYARGIAGIAIGRDTQSGVNSITIGRMARAAYSRPGNIGNPGAKVTHPLGGDDTNNPVFNKNAVAIGTNSLAGASNIVFLTPGTENTYLDFASTANIWASRVYSRAQMTKIKDGTKKHISDRFYGEGDINTAASDDKKVNFYDVVRDSGTDQVAVGHHSRALGDQAIAIGSNSIAGRYSIVMGGNTFGDGKQNDSFYAMYLNNDGIFRKLSGYRKVDNNPGNPNEGSTYAGEAGVAIGTKAHVLTQMGTAVGALARIEQDSFGAVALGAGASVGTQKAGHDSIGAVAIGMGSAAKGNGTVVLGARASAWPDSGDAHRITAVGYGTIAKNADSVALGSLAEADRGSDMAGYFYGYKAATIDQSKEAGSIQLKLKDGAADLIENYEVKVTPSAWEVPKATETDIENGIRTHVYAGLKGPAFKANAGALSIGKNGSTPDATDAITRQIVNVAAGTNDTDAVNVAQLRNVNMMVEADSAGAGTPKAFSDFLLDNARLKISGQSYLSTELTQDKEGPRITLKAKTTELIANPDGSFSTKNHEDGLITAGELVKRMNAAKQARDELEKKIGELVYLNAKGEKLQQKGGKFFKVNPDGSLDESKEETPAAITSKRQGLQLANVNGAVTQLTPDGLADLSNISEKTGVNVNDISKIGWILSVPDDKYSEAVVHNRKVSFFGKDLAKVTAAGKGEEPRMITVTVDRKETGKAVEQEFLNNGFTQIRYVDANNKPLVRAQDGKYYYPVSDKDNTPDTSKPSVAPAARVADVESHPTVLTNVKHGADVINKTGDPTDGLADLSKDSQKSNVATVEDLRNLGFVIKGKADDDSAVTGQVKHANTVEFAGEDLAHVVVTSKDGKHKVTVKVNKDDVTQAVNAANAQKGTAPTAYVDKDGNPLVKGDDGNYHKVKDDGTLDNDTTDPAGVRLGEKDTPMQLTNVKPGTNEITAEGPTKGLADLEHAVPGTVATVDDLKKMGFVVADGANYHATVANAQTVKFVGEGLATVTGETKDNIRTFTVKVDKDEVAKAINADSAKKGAVPTTYVDKDGNPLVKAKDGKYYPKDKVGDDGTPQTGAQAVDSPVIQVGEKGKPIQLTNVKPGTNEITAEGPTKGLADLANAKSGTVATVDDLKRVGFVVADGANYHETVTNAQTVKFVGEGLAEVSGKTENDVRTFTVKVDDKKVADAVKSINDKAGNAPTQYVDKDGNSLVKAKDGKYYPKDKVGDDGQPKPDAKSVDPAGIQVGEKGNPAQLTNVKPGTNEITAEGPTKGLADLEHAVPGTVATVDDLQKLGFVIKGKAADGTTDVVAQVKHANTVEFAGEDLAKVVTESKDGVSKVTVKVSKEDIAKAVNAENAKKGSEPTTYVDKDGNPLVKGSDGKYYKPKADGTLDTDGGAVDPAGVRLGEKDKPIQLTNVAPATKAIDKENDPTKGLADLANAKSGTVATVDDLKRVGFVVADGGNYHATVTNAQTVKFVGEGLAEVSGKTEDNVRTFTVKVDDKKVADAVKSINDKAGNAPTQYVDKDGNPLVKAKDGNYYPKDKVGDDGLPTQGAQAVEPAGIQVGEKGKTTQLTNVAPATKAIDKENDPTNGLADLANAKSGTVATVDDLKRVGFVVADGGNYHATVTNAQTVKFVGEGLAEVSGKTENDVRTFTVKVDDKKVADAVKSINDKAGNAPTQYVDKDGNPLVKAKDGNYYPKDKVGDDGQPKPDAKSVEPAGIQVGEKGKTTQLTNVAPATEAINKADDPTNGLADLANAKSGTVATVDDLKRVGFVVADGGNYHATVTNAQTVKFVGEGLAEVSGKTEDNVRTFTVKVDDKKVADAVKSINDKAGNAPTQYVDKDGNPLVKAKDGNYYPKDKVGDDGQPKPDAKSVEPAGIQVGEKGKTTQLTNVAPATEAINKANDPTNGLADLANAKDGTVATVADLKKLGFVIKGKAEDGTTDVVAQVKHADTVEFAGEDLAKVITESANGVSKVTVKVNKEEIAKAVNAENAKKGSEPTTYVDENGDPLVKGDDGKYYKPKADGTPDTDAGEKTPAGIRLGEKDKPIQLDNVARGTETKPVNGKDGQPIMGSDNQPLQLVDLKDAKDTKVATVGDLKDMGFVLGASVNAAGGNKAYQDVVKNGNKVKFVGLGGAWISGKTAADGTRIITIDVNADNLVTGTQNAIQYVDGKGNRMIPMLQKGNEVLYYNAADNPVKHKMPNSDEEAVYRMSDIVEGTGTLKPDAQPLQGKKAADVPNLGVALVHPNGSADTTEGTVLRNVGVGTATIAAPTDDKDIVGKAKAGLADLANSKDTNGLSVADAKKLGFVIKGKAADGTTDVTGQVKHANTVEFAGEDLAKVITESANGVSKVTVKVNKEDIVKVVNDANDKKGSAPTQYVDKDGNPLVKAKDGKYYPKDKVGDDGTPQTGAQAVDPVGIQVGEKDKPTQLMNIAPGTTSIATPTDPNASQADKAKAGLADLSIPTDAASDNVSKHTAATVDDLRRMGWILSVGDTYADKVQNAQEVNFKGAGLAEVSGQTEGQKRVITVTVDEQKVAAAVKAINDKAGNAPIHYVDQEGNPLVKAKDNKYYPTDKVDNEGNVIAGAKDAVPVVQIGEKGHPMQLTNVAAGTSEIKEGPTKGLADLEHAASGTVATVDDLQKLGFVIKGTDENGKAVSGQVRHANTVEFAGDGLAKVITESKDGVSKVTVKVNKEEIAKAVNAENAKNGSTPTKYVDKDGNSLVKGENGKYYKAKDDGTPDTEAGEKMPAGVQIGEKDKPITVTNVKSNFDAVAPNAKEAKAPESKKNPDGSVDPTAANPLVAMQHNAATIADIMNSPWNLQVNGKAVKAVKAFDTVNITDGTNTKVVATETGYKVNVVGLPTAYTDNAGNTIAKGTDGKWFITDKDGNMTATPADLGQDGKGTPSVSLVNPAAEPGKAGEPVVMHNVGQGNLPTDAVNKDQMDTAIAGMAKAIGNTKDEAHGIGADAAALAALKPLQYDPVEPTQIMAGIGNYQQKTAVALGVAHYTNESTMLNAGVSLGTGHTMVNVGYTRKFGHTKDEKEIPDRYKAGPISSIYVMQDEVSALKAENEQQKREIQELREMVLAMAANKK
ncbi:ESPR-type extended signal peptide-containing protein [uncultured Megasphaera sp.]|uniref:ESPR-type extended signal peptide-containing protein n=1 Tax=uncultured Megasphaera sp. TaxID=165188 RepID=UPI0025975E1E|nr:ESPR-type extended signal peptide-containing protein [uncultured Megasphaera sp.]